MADPARARRLAKRNSTIVASAIEYATAVFRRADNATMIFTDCEELDEETSTSRHFAELVRLAESVVQDPSNDAHGIHEIAGPEERQIAQLMRGLLGARGDKRRVLEMPLPGRFGKGLRDGAILPSTSAKLDDVTFEEWLVTSRDGLSV